MWRVYIGGVLLAIFRTFMSLVEEYGFEHAFEPENVGKKWAGAATELFTILSSLIIFHVLLLAGNP
jgi:hypothetical protein